jgi:hypothetical protein
VKVPLESFIMSIGPIGAIKILRGGYEGT